MHRGPQRGFGDAAAGRLCWTLSSNRVETPAVTINWFPGHMNKARREIGSAMAETDVVIEVLDARLPTASQNPMLEELRGQRPCLKVLAKSDLADPAVTRAWLRFLEEREGVLALAANAHRRPDVRRIPALCRRLAPHRGKPGKSVRAMVVGIPNVGKSTLINTLKGRKVTDVENRPAVTRRQQRVALDTDLSLNDTPGVLWPKLADQAGAYRLAATGGVRDTAFDACDVAEFAAGFLIQRYPELLEACYKLDRAPGEPRELLEAIGRKRGLLLRGGRLDLDRAAEILLRELRSGKIGRISLEEPPGS
jgi:ribosome biogenesis GTPase A